MSSFARFSPRGDFSQFAAATYARGFIRIYADCLGVDPAPLLEELLTARRRVMDR